MPLRHSEAATERHRRPSSTNMSCSWATESLLTCCLNGKKGGKQRSSRSNRLGRNTSKSMAHVFTDFERWALSLPVPSWNLPALNNPTYLDLIERAEIVCFTGHWYEEG